MPPGKSVLLVDDSQSFRMMMERALRRVHEATQVFSMASGEDAVLHLRLCGTSRPMPGIVLLDRAMPGGMDGLATLELIRQEDHLQELPVVIVSGSDLAEHIGRARIAGADEYLVKGGDMDSLESIAKRVCAWRPEESWRTSGDRMTGQSLVVREASLQSPFMQPAISPLTNVPSAQDESGFLRVFQTVRDFVVKSLDPVDFAISELCRKHHITVAHARGRQQDQITVRNRRAVIFGFWDMGFSDPITLENFQLSQRAIERLRAEWRQKGGGPLSDRPL